MNKYKYNTKDDIKIHKYYEFNKPTEVKFHTFDSIRDTDKIDTHGKQKGLAIGLGVDGKEFILLHNSESNKIQQGSHSYLLPLCNMILSNYKGVYKYAKIIQIYTENYTMTGYPAYNAYIHIDKPLEARGGFRTHIPFGIKAHPNCCGIAIGYGFDRNHYKSWEPDLAKQVILEYVKQTPIMVHIAQNQNDAYNWLINFGFIHINSHKNPNSDNNIYTLYYENKTEINTEENYLKTKQYIK